MKKKQLYKMFTAAGLAAVSALMLFSACDDGFFGPLGPLPNEYTVTYNINGGSGSTPSSQTVKPGRDVYLPSGSGFSRSGFTFGGWNTSSSGTGTSYSASSYFTPYGNMTLYARWVSSGGVGGSGTETNPLALSPNIWAHGSIFSSASGAAAWYSFNVVNGTRYYVWWNNSWRGDGTKTLDVYATASYSDGTQIFTNVNDGWTSSQSFIAHRTGTVRIRITPYSSGSTGTFAVVYNTNGVRP